MHTRATVPDLYRASAFLSPTPEWIALAPAGTYDASPAAEAHLRWRDDSGFWPVGKSHEAYYRPKDVVRALAAE